MTRLYGTYEIRVQLVSALFFICSVAILGKMLHIQLFQADNLRQITINAGFAERSVKGHRGNISDSNGLILAETVKTYTFWANTQKEADKNTIAALFATTFNQPIDYYNKLLSQRKKYIPLTKALNRTQCLPRKCKKMVEDKYREWMEELKQYPDTERIIHDYESLIDYMWKDDKTHELGNFFDRVNQLDKLRGESFLDTFTEYEKLKEYYLSNDFWKNRE